MKLTIILSIICGIMINVCFCQNNSSLLNMSDDANFTTFVNMDEYNSLVALTDATQFTLKGNTYLGNVVSIYDGDTTKNVIKICEEFYKFDFRLNGIDTPEVSTGVVKEFGKEVRDILRSMIFGKVVRIAAGQGDKYGRVLCTLYGWTSQGVININQYLINYAMAKAYDGGTKIQFAQTDYNYFIANYRNTQWPTFMHYPYQSTFLQSTTTNSSICISPCQVCSLTGNLCHYCTKGYFLSPIQLKCMKIPNDAYGVIPSSNLIYQCIAGCQACSTISSCNRCIMGFVLDPINKICNLCNPLCKTCSTSSISICLTCYQKFFLQNGDCVPCSSDLCLKCSNLNICTKCVESYSPKAGICIQCETGCKQCDLTTDLCLQCQKGYTNIVAISGELQCIACLSGCSLCNETDITLCQGCNSGYYLDNSNVCQKCLRQCSECRSLDLWTQCIQNYELNSNGKCIQQCSFPCQLCNQGRDQCIRCFGGYETIKGLCLPDFSCNSSSNCNYCPRQFGIRPQFLDLTFGTCESCSIQKCIKCKYDQIKTTLKCMQCSAGLIVSVNGQCQQCPSSCSSCISPYYCLSCSLGYYLHKQSDISSGICLSCSQFSNCATCINSANKCTSCLTNYILEGSNCISQKSITISLKLNITPVQFYPYINEFKKSILALIGYIQHIYLRDIVILSITEGSTDVKLKVGLRKQDSAEQSFKSLSTGLEVGTSIAGITILSSTLERQNFSQDKQDKQNSPEDQTQNSDGNFFQTSSKVNQNLKLLLGIGIAVGVASILLIILGIYCFKKKSYRKIVNTTISQSELHRINPQQAMVRITQLR